MLIFNYKMGVHWYFRFAVETADNRGPTKHRAEAPHGISTR